MVTKWNADGIEHVNGDYVGSEDYDALEKEREELKKHNEELANQSDETAQRLLAAISRNGLLLAEIERLRVDFAACRGQLKEALANHHDNREIAARAVESCADYLEKITPKMRTQSVIARKFAAKIRNGDIEL